MNIEIIDNFFEKDFFDGFQNFVMGQEFKWSRTDHTTSTEDNIQSLTYVLYNDDKGKVPDELYYKLRSAFASKINIHTFIRMKFNCYFATEDKQTFPYHVDQDCIAKFKTAVFYINTNNGGTKFKTGEFVESVANRIAIFDGDIEHATVTCTDQPARAVLNLNYIV
jgi:hypothetical protein